MPNEDTQRMIDLVGEKTGYRMVVDVVSHISDHAQVVSATPQAPTHVVEVNASVRQYADYLVAIQCGMLVVTWSDPSRVPGMTLDREKCGHLSGKWANSKQLRKLPGGAGQKMADHLLQGLARQLFSTPLEIRALRMCHELCPTLRDMQAEYLSAQFRTLSEIFSPQNSDRLPAEVIKRSVSMNAALAFAWFTLSGSRLAILPYESMGHADEGRKLLDAVDANPGRLSESHIKTVDAWAEHLSMRTLYQWEFSNRCQ